MAKRYEHFKGHYFEPAAKFFADKRPTDLPTTVVYPFGGGDLIARSSRIPTRATSRRSPSSTPAIRRDSRR